jgi:hypothetical protein
MQRLFTIRTGNISINGLDVNIQEESGGKLPHKSRFLGSAGNSFLTSRLYGDYLIYNY